MPRCPDLGGGLISEVVCTNLYIVGEEGLPSLERWSYLRGSLHQSLHSGAVGAALVREVVLVRVSTVYHQW